MKRMASLSPRSIITRGLGRVFGAAAEHHFTDRVLNAPSPLWRPPFPWRRFTQPEGERHIASLRRDGIAILPMYFSVSELQGVHAELEAAFANPPAAEMEFRPSGQFYACTQPLAICQEFSEASVDPDLLNIVSGYFRRWPFLSESDFRRVMPLDLREHERTDPKFAKGHSASHWHYDLRGRQIKVMSYLNDVGPEDQNFAYCPGTQTGFKSSKYEHSRFSDKEIESRSIRVLECLAPAGTAIVFDSNGLHRLRRRPTRPRDSVTFNYHAGRMYRAIPQRLHTNTSAEARRRLATLSTLA